MTFVEQWHHPITVQLTLGEALVLHAALTQVIATLWVPSARETATEACGMLLNLANENYSTALCERLLNTILDTAPDLLETPK